MLHFLEYSIQFLNIFLNCRNKTTQFFKHSKHESNSFYSIFKKGNATIVSFSIFPVIFKRSHLLISIYFNSTHMFSKKLFPGAYCQLFLPQIF